MDVLEFMAPRVGLKNARNKNRDETYRWPSSNSDWSRNKELNEGMKENLKYSDGPAHKIWND